MTIQQKTKTTESSITKEQSSPKTSEKSKVKKALAGKFKPPTHTLDCKCEQCTSSKIDIRNKQRPQQRKKRKTTTIHVDGGAQPAEVSKEKRPRSSEAWLPGSILTDLNTKTLCKVVDFPVDDLYPVRYVDIDGVQWIRPENLSKVPPRLSRVETRVQSINKTKAKYVATVLSHAAIARKLISQREWHIEKQHSKYMEFIKAKHTYSASLAREHSSFKEQLRTTLATACVLSTATLQTFATTHIKGTTLQVSESKEMTSVNNKWLIDTGSEALCTPSPDDFTLGSYKPQHDAKYVTDAGGNLHQIAGIGTIRLLIKTTGGLRDLILQDAFHIPTFKLRIISVAKLRATGHGIHLPAGEPGYMEVSGGHRAHFATHGSLEFLVGPANVTSVGVNAVPIDVSHRNAISQFRSWCRTAPREHLIERLAYPHPTDTKHHTRRIREQLAMVHTRFRKPSRRRMDQTSLPAIPRFSGSRHYLRKRLSTQRDLQTVRTSRNQVLRCVPPIKSR
jgi:hypothetical protein